MKQWYLLMMVCLMPVELFAQNNSIPALERDVTLNISNQPIATILEAISQQADFVFSYNPDAINSNDLYSINIRQKSVRHALNLMFEGSVEYKVRGKYVILKKSKPVLTNSSKKERVIEGYVTDSKSGHKLTDVSVYDKDLLVSVITDRYGYFQMELPSGQTKSGLHVSKQGYSDTLIAPLLGKTSYVNVELSSTTDIVKETTSKSTLNPSDVGSGKSLKFPHWLIPNKIRINTRNIKDTVFRNVQISLLPLISTNKLLTGSAVNNVSINLTAGYVQGVRVAEVGGVLNMVREDAKVCQLAGVGNIVGGSFLGFQAAGVVNTTKTMKGVQAGGVINIVHEDAGKCQLAGLGNMVGGSFQGVQAAGAFNFTKTFKGVQAGGVFNKVRDSAGICQLAGVGNMVGGAFNGLQLAGVGNISKTLTGVQASGVFNTVLGDASNCQLAGVGNVVLGSFRGLQLAGVINCAQELDGVQISGLVNTALFFKGVQLSVFNFADSCDGVPIGVFSYVRKNGYHKIELSGDELFYSNIAFRTGVKRFHNIFTAGIRPDNFKTPLWVLGYGVGTTFGSLNKLLYDIDLMTQHISKGNFSEHESDLYKIYLGIDRKIASGTSIAVGITYNFYVSNTNYPDYQEAFSTISPYSLSNHTSHNGLNLKTWIGAKIGVRFL